MFYTVIQWHYYMARIWRIVDMRYVKIILGNSLITSAYAFLTVSHKIINGGVTSFSMIAASFLHSDTALIANVITLLLLALCYCLLGKDYFKGTIVSGICSKKWGGK